MYVISEKVCPQDHACPLVKHCPVGAIHQDGFSLPVVDQKLCIRCGKCYASCLKKAVIVVDDEEEGM